MNHDIYNYSLIQSFISVYFGRAINFFVLDVPFLAMQNSASRVSHLSNIESTFYTNNE